MRTSRASIALLTALLVLAPACTDPGSSADPEPSPSHTPLQGVLPSSAPPLGPADPQHVADTAAATLASIFANNDAANGDKYRQDIERVTGCRIRESDVAYLRKDAEIELRARQELIEELTGNPAVTAVGYARERTRSEIQPTIGNAKRRAELIAVVVALLCPE